MSEEASPPFFSSTTPDCVTHAPPPFRSSQPFRAYDTLFATARPDLPRRFPTGTPYHVPQLGVPPEIIRYRDELRRQQQQQQQGGDGNGDGDDSRGDRAPAWPASTTAAAAASGERDPLLPPPPNPTAEDFKPRGVAVDALGRERREPRVIAANRDDDNLAAALSPRVRQRLEEVTGDAPAAGVAGGAARQRRIFGGGGGGGAAPFVPFAVRPFGHDAPKWVDPRALGALDPARARAHRRWDVSLAEVVEAQVTAPQRVVDHTLVFKTQKRIVAYDDDEGFAFSARPMVNTLAGLRFLARSSSRATLHSEPHQDGDPPSSVPPLEGLTHSKLEAEEAERLRAELNTSLASDASDVVTLGCHILVFSRDRRRAMRFDPSSPTKRTGTISGVWDVIELLGDAPRAAATLVPVEREESSCVADAGAPARTSSFCSIVAIEGASLFWVDLTASVRFHKMSIHDDDDDDDDHDDGNQRVVDGGGGGVATRRAFRWQRSDPITGYAPFSVGWIHPVLGGDALYIRCDRAQHHVLVHISNAFHAGGSRHVTPLAPVAAPLRSAPCAEALFGVPGAPDLAIAPQPQGAHCWVYAFFRAARNWVPLHRLENCLCPLPLWVPARRAVFVFGSHPRNRTTIKAMFKLQLPPPPTPPAPPAVASCRDVDDLCRIFPVTALQQQSGVAIDTPPSQLAALCPIFDGCFAILAADLECYVPAEIDRWQKVRAFVHGAGDDHGNEVAEEHRPPGGK